MKKSNIDTSNMIPFDEIKNIDSEDRDELVILADEAYYFLGIFDWFDSVKRGWLDRGWGYMLGIFYFEIIPTDKSGPNDVWVIVGDIPPAYIDTDNFHNGAQALDGYVGAMQEWVDLVLSKKSVEDAIPVAISPTKKNAEKLAIRLKLINDEVLSKFKDELIY